MATNSKARAEGWLREVAVNPGARQEAHARFCHRLSPVVSAGLLERRARAAALKGWNLALGFDPSPPIRGAPLRVRDGRDRDTSVFRYDIDNGLRKPRQHVASRTGVVFARGPHRWPFRYPLDAENAKLDLVPLALAGGEIEDLRSAYEPYRSPDRYAPLWRKLTAKPRGCFELDPIAWGAFPGADIDENPTCDAAELADAGDREGAREILMEVLSTDLRCIDAHAHLGNLEFERSSERAIVHYEIGIRIGELSLPPGFDGVLVWGRIYNRPFLRCLHGYGLCLWRLGKLAEAQRVFERILSLNPNDNQGVRFCWEDVRQGRSWETTKAREDAEREERRRISYTDPPSGALRDHRSSTGRRDDQHW